MQNFKFIHVTLQPQTVPNTFIQQPYNKIELPGTIVSHLSQPGQSKSMQMTPFTPSTHYDAQHPRTSRICYHLSSH